MRDIEAQVPGTAILHPDHVAKVRAMLDGRDDADLLAEMLGVDR